MSQIIYLHLYFLLLLFHNNYQINLVSAKNHLLVKDSRFHDDISDPVGICG